MFHRVKSENQDEQENQVEQEVAVETTEAPVEQEAAEEAPVAETKEEPAPVAEVSDKPAYEIPAKTYQRPTQTASSVGGYPGSSYSPSYKTTTTSAPVEEVAEEKSSATKLADDGSERTLTIGRGITMSGEIESCDQLVVEGTVEASLKGARNLDISETGTFYGTVEIEEAVIAGRFEGEIAVNGRLVVTETGVITGSISYRELQVESGAVIDGRITPIREQAAPQAVKPAPKKDNKEKAAALAKAKEVKAQQETQPTPANTDGGLFAKSSAAAE